MQIMPDPFGTKQKLFPVFLSSALYPESCLLIEINSILLQNDIIFLIKFVIKIKIHKFVG